MKPPCGCQDRHLCSYHEGEADGRAAALAEVCAYLRSYPMGEVWADAIERHFSRGDTRPRGEGSSKP